MTDDRDRNQPKDGAAPEPFRESGSGADYTPGGNWGAERRADNPAGDGGFGPEGDYTAARGAPNGDAIGPARDEEPERNTDHSRRSREQGSE